MEKTIINQEWYTSLIDECRAIITEAIFTSRWALVEGYWTLGQRIREDSQLKKWSQNEAGAVLQGLAKDLDISTRTIHYALQAYDKYPDITQLPEGKNISWNKLITTYLPEPKDNLHKDRPIPQGEFNVIYADPPWKYSNEQHSKEKQETVLESHYPTMEIEEICKLEIPSSYNSVLFLWTTSPMLFEAKKIIDAWGFDYKSSIIWDKIKHNVGYYVSVRHEFLLICTKGSFLKESNNLIDSVVSIERKEHSQKPEKFYEIIEEMYPNGKYLELFSRNKRKNWTMWGNQNEL